MAQLFGSLTGIILFGAIIGGWITHLVVSIQAQEWLFMIVGALLGPIAVIHGWATWLGYSWF